MSNHEDGGLMGEFKVVKDPMLSASRSEVQLALHNKATHPVTTEMLRQASLKRGRLASEFLGFDTEGHWLSLKDLSRSKPVVLFFIEASCPCSRDASKFLSQLQRVYKERCTVIGVIDSDATIAKKWAQLAQCTFRLFPDAHQSTISGYQVPSSVYSILIAPGGRIERTYPGYSQSMLKELNSRVALLSGTAPKSLSVQKAPKQLTTGCRFAGSAIAVALQ
jgi:peroxiredoxin